ncbi:glycosyltransferase [Candidatus Bathyarchaeota archaeon]|nr:glycosyltransferase [Candidatus Bathyarchaeota archaeon]
MRVSIVMPAYNERSRIVEAVSRALEAGSRAGLDTEVVVVDDGSTDGTGDVVEAAGVGGGRVRLVRYGVNMGKGYAVRRGVEASTGDYVVFMDSDGEVDPEELRRYVRGLGGSDVCVGSKWHPESRVQAPVVRRMLSRVFHILVRLLTGVQCSDTQAGMKAFRRDALLRIARLQLVKKYAFDVELLAVASLLKLRIREMPVKILLRSGFRRREIMRMLVDLMGIVYRLRVIRWYQQNLKIQEPKYRPIIRL